MFSEDGVVTEGIGIFEDITERNKMDKELKNRIKELEIFYNLAIKREHKIRKLEDARRGKWKRDDWMTKLHQLRDRLL